MTFVSGKVKFAVVGCGHIGKRHAAMIQAQEESELIALCDIRPRQELQLQALEQTPLYESVDTLLAEHPDLDVICICTPNGLHAQQALQALDAHKHVLVEKPMALTKAHCEQLIFKALNVSRQVFCVMQNRYSPAAAWLKEIVEEGRLGDLISLQVNCFWNRDDRYYSQNGKPHPWHGSADLDGGVLFTQFAHFIDILYWLFGDIDHIQAQFQNAQHQHNTAFPDTGTVQFEFVNGGLGALSFSTAVWDRNFESSISIIGSQGSVRLGGQYMNEVTHCHMHAYQLPELPPTNPPNEYGGYSGSAANHQYVIQNVVDVLKGRQAATTNALEGMKVVDIIERIYKAGNT